MKIIKRELYVFMYGKKQAEEKIKEKLRKKKVLSAFVPLTLIFGLFTGVDVVGSISLGVLLWALIWLIPEVIMKQKCNEIKTGFKLDIPDFLDITALLLEAGQPLWYAVRQASRMGESGLCRRINCALEKEAGMEEGRNPEVLLNRLAEEIKVAEVSSAVSVIVQNSRKGEKELATILRLQSNICRQERKSVAQEMGNRTSNLLLIPSGMVFIAVLLMLIAPAIMQLNVF